MIIWERFSGRGVRSMMSRVAAQRVGRTGLHAGGERSRGASRRIAQGGIGETLWAAR
jgi:hypothetical protein